MQIDNLVLRPNCLLTKYPLVFLTGPRSLFYYEKLGRVLQDYLTAHGYMVLSPAMPFRSSSLRSQFLKQWLKNQKFSQFHFVSSSSTYLEFASLLENYKDSTFTKVSEFNIEKNTVPLKYRLHQMFCAVQGCTADPYDQTLPTQNILFYDRFLDHCIELAENESI